MSVRKRRLFLGWLLIDVAAIGIAVWQIINTGPEPRRAAGNVCNPSPELLLSGGTFLSVGAPPLAGVSPIMESVGPYFAFSKLPIGEQAQDFALPRVGKGPLVRLGELRATKPVVLIFASFTCDVFCGRIAELESFYRHYRDRAEFLLVVVKEANHSIPGLEFLLKAENPTSEQRRRLLARALEIKKVTIPTVIDNENRTVEKAYFGWPFRVVVVDSEGKIKLDLPFRVLPVVGPNLNRLQVWLKDHFG